MYENVTFTSLLQRMLDRVPNDVDKREGSIIYDALAPAAAELGEMYAQLDIQMALTFGDTSSGEYLSRRTADFGIIRQPATKAKRLGRFYGGGDTPFDIPIGSRFSANQLNFRAIERLADGEYALECESVGRSGNEPYGALLPIDYVNGLASAMLMDILVPGEDEESDDLLRSRFFAEIQSPGTSGNQSDYRKWALSIAGVGDVRVEPLWNGPGTVRVVVIDSNKKPATSQLVDDVQQYICPVAGTGEGVAPIGANVTVTAAQGVAINVSASVELTGTSNLATVKIAFSEALEAYLRSIAFSSDPSPKYVRIGSMLLDVPGIHDFASLTVNGGDLNVTVLPGQVAVIGEVTLSE
ncbi:baseplate J/gp47 family protein [Paenibacillus harenae]|uniref:baseplate J/gp47 family protein n=1 Tax=Paenibacillus harenae TaxID=306543 RepID=UPI0027913A4B|nr:baseplate J/gp47 family protein [Paenibacillus harenae]MDQ0063563.1 putative phage protein gp47/JayE [Paenibacillus harenae]